MYKENSSFGGAYSTNHDLNCRREWQLTGSCLSGKTTLIAPDLTPYVAPGLALEEALCGGDQNSVQRTTACLTTLIIARVEPNAFFSVMGFPVFAPYSVQLKDIFSKPSTSLLMFKDVWPSLPYFLMENFYSQSNLDRSALSSVDIKQALTRTQSSQKANGVTKPPSAGPTSTLEWHPTIARALKQLATTLGLYLALLAGAFYTAQTNILASIPLWFATGLFVVRLFILQHDCAHHAFFRSKVANDVVGSMLGVITLTPHAYWRKSHVKHHATSGDLDRRGCGDIYTYTVDEYKALSNRDRFWYRLYRNPWVVIFVGPLVQFVIRFRLWWIAPEGTAERRSIHFTNLFLATFLLLAYFQNQLFLALFGYILVMQVAAGTGLILFYVQHQCEGAYWRRGPDWEREASALDGSSYLVLPRWAEWLVAGINLHHIHHLRPRIPNYLLRTYMKKHNLNDRAPKIYLRDIPHAFSLKLYDEHTKTMVGFKYIKPNI